MSRLDPVLMIAALLQAAPFGHAGEGSEKKVVTLVVDFDQAAAEPRVLNALKSELAEIWSSAHVQLDWRPIESLLPGESFAELVVVHFKGNCQAGPGPLMANPFFIDERGPQGPLAYSPKVDGQVLPFSSVLCDTVQRSIQAAMRPSQRKTADSLFGRALGRVLSHELYHILNQTSRHESEGLAKRSLTGSQLIGPRLNFARPQRLQ